MRIVHTTASVIVSTVALTLPCEASLTAAGTNQPQYGPAGAAQSGNASGDFGALVFFDTLVTRDVGSKKCEFVVNGQLTFTGTLEGVALGTTTALINAPCAEATDLANIGAFRDVFRFEGTFSGTVDDGSSTTGSLTYAGVTSPGGSIDANIKFRADNARATLHTVGAQLGVGGEYRGVVVTKK